MQLKTRLISALAAILITVFLATSIINYVVTRNAVRDDLLRSALPLTGKNIYSEIHSALMRPLLVSSAMANDTFLRDWVTGGEQNEDAVRRYLSRIKKEYGFLSTFFVSAVTDRYYTPDGILKKISPRDPHDVWFYAFTRYKEPYDLDIDVNQAAGNTMTVFVNFRLEDDRGRLLGVTGAGIALDKALELLDEAQRTYLRQAFLIDQDGLIQIHPDTSLVEKAYITEMDGLRDIAPDILAGQGDAVSLQYDAGGRHYLLTSRYIPEFKWHLLVVQDEMTALRTARGNFMRTLAMGFVSTLVILALCVLAVNKYQARIEHLARTDPLTGAANRRELEERFDLAAYRASRDGIPFSILIIDLDGFKEVNDRLGHLAGDEVLASMARVIRGRLRPTDLLARWGGDEFIILLDGNEESARALARRISAAVCAAPDIPVGFSSGVAAYRDSDDLTSLTRRADNAMYQAKARGGDCVMAAEDL